MVGSCAGCGRGFVAVCLSVCLSVLVGCWFGAEVGIVCPGGGLRLELTSGVGFGFCCSVALGSSLFRRLCGCLGCLGRSVLGSGGCTCCLTALRECPIGEICCRGLAVV